MKIIITVSKNYPYDIITVAEHLYDYLYYNKGVEFPKTLFDDGTIIQLLKHSTSHSDWGEKFLFGISYDKTLDLEKQ